jgi:hypothetical protein
MEEKKTTLTDLNKMTAKFIVDAIKSGDYECEFTIDGPKIDDMGYVNVLLSIGGEKMRVAVNKKGYVCWFNELSRHVKDIIDDYGVAMKLVEDVFSKLNN